jgi:IS30 family transposase
MPSPSEKDRKKIEDRAVPGHWEGDLISGSKNSHMVTLVERHSRFRTLIKVPSKDTAVVVAALSRKIRKLSATLRQSLTWDRGLEMAKHKTFTVPTDVKVWNRNTECSHFLSMRRNRRRLLPPRRIRAEHSKPKLDSSQHGA